jgi:hypothetical protein
MLLVPGRVTAETIKPPANEIITVGGFGKVINLPVKQN